MNKRNTTLSIAAVFAASVLALQSPIAGAAGDTSASADSTTTSAQASDSQPGIAGTEVNVGQNASDSGLPGVEMNVGAQGDQNNVDTSTLGAGPDSGTADAQSEDSMLNPRADRG
ncbi:MAG TPA: hypothetical protein VEB23_09255 [Ramlibacter sp.]|nr:hypothetical protein [Ramlibacter sp.]